MSFGELIKQRREELGMTQEELAVLMDKELTRQAISKWELGPAAYPEVESLLCLSVILDISLDKLFSDELSYLNRNKPSNLEKYPGLVASIRTFAETLEKIKL